MKYIKIPTDNVSRLFLEAVVNDAPALQKNAARWRMGQRILEAFESESGIAKLKDEDHATLLEILEGDDCPLPSLVLVRTSPDGTRTEEAIRPPRRVFLNLVNAVAEATDELCADEQR